jgi:hypothetical protein
MSNEFDTILFGGDGSGNFGHAGRIGEVGGSAPDGAGRINEITDLEDQMKRRDAEWKRADEYKGTLDQKLESAKRDLRIADNKGEHRTQAAVDYHQSIVSDLEKQIDAQNPHGSQFWTPDKTKELRQKWNDEVRAHMAANPSKGAALVQKHIEEKLGFRLSELQGAIKKHNFSEFADFNSQWIEIFMAGSYGPKGDWSEGDLDKVVTNFASGAWKPPAVLGHPQTDSPAMGWVSALKRDGRVLKARFAQVQPELESLVRNGRYPNRSAAFYANPQGNGPVLRHVGFLGAVPPEVKGLGPVSFSQEQFTLIDFQEESAMPDKTIKEQIAEFFAELFGKKPEAGTFNEAQVSEMITKAVASATAPLIAQNTALTTQFTELNKRLDTSSTEAKKAKAVAFVEKLKAAGKWLPAWTVAGVPAVLEQLAVSGGTVKFGEPGKEVEMTAFDQMCAFYEGLPSQIPIGDITGRRKSTTGKVINFNEAKGIDLDMQSVALNERAEQIAKEQKLEFGEALNLAIQEQSA